MMAELETQNASLALYRYMCQKIVGSEEYVKTVRMMNTVRDNLYANEDVVIITSGSYGEGLGIQGSDFDIMNTIKYIEVCEDSNIHINPHKIYFAMETEDTQPCFTQLRLFHSNLDVSKFCEERDGNFYFSSALVKAPFDDQDGRDYVAMVHGPCLSDKYGITDFALCLHSKSWITAASPWITRSNNSWPGKDVKQSILQHGTLFVPIGVKGSTNEDLEWRFSFSVGEKYLMYTFTHTQLICYALMKILLKDIIDVSLECQHLLCSYFIKTILFWISEELFPTIWRPENLISNFMRCFRRLIYCVENSVCLHYFIPENNLFENRIKGYEQEILLRKLRILNNYGWQCVLFSHQFSNFQNLALCSLKEPGSLHVDSLDKLLFSMFWVAECFIHAQNTQLEKMIHIVMSIQSSKIKYFYMFYMSKVCRRIVQVIPFNDISGNKLAYKQFKTCISTLLRNVLHDAVSGWLMLASFFYKIKQYDKAIYILKYSLLKCTSEKIHPGSHLAQRHYELLDLKIFSKMTIPQLLQLLLVDDVVFFENSTLLPDELLIEDKTTASAIPPVVYSHVLSFLCYYHVNDARQCRNSLWDLKLTIEDNYFIRNTLNKADSYNILGEAFQLTGDIESAKHAFIQSIKLIPDQGLNIAFLRLAEISSM